MFPTEYVREVIASENQERHWAYQDARERTTTEKKKRGRLVLKAVGRVFHLINERK